MHVSWHGCRTLLGSWLCKICHLCLLPYCSFWKALVSLLTLSPTVPGSISWPTRGNSQGNVSLSCTWIAQNILGCALHQPPSLGLSFLSERVCTCSWEWGCYCLPHLACLSERRLQGSMASAGRVTGFIERAKHTASDQFFQFAVWHRSHVGRHLWARKNKGQLEVQ